MSGMMQSCPKASPLSCIHCVGTAEAPLVLSLSCDPVLVWVVDTGMPSQVAPYSAKAPPISAQKPCTGVRCVMRDPTVRTIRQPPHTVPSAIALWRLNTTQNGTWNPPVDGRELPVQQVRGNRDYFPGPDT